MRGRSLCVGCRGLRVGRGPRVRAQHATQAGAPGVPPRRRRCSRGEGGVRVVAVRLSGLPGGRRAVRSWGRVGLHSASSMFSSASTPRDAPPTGGERSGARDSRHRTEFSSFITHQPAQPPGGAAAAGPPQAPSQAVPDHLRRGAAWAGPRREPQLLPPPRARPQHASAPTAVKKRTDGWMRPAAHLVLTRSHGPTCVTVASSYANQAPSSGRRTKAW